MTKEELRKSLDFVNEERERLQRELERKDNIINELKQNKRDYESENILEMKLHILDNNWNELKKWLKEQFDIYLGIDKLDDTRISCQLLRVLDKIKELESK